ncbi:MULTISPECIES: PspC domain-containing protein [unclassified Arthrobacter]|uniref:PspC domain-containing protein n=1 Tax=unclassified Arthrobacter TaxID=235627 RepID=UPI001D1360B0|nr:MULTISPECIES: PspC domain-containing protein [unclassified Arthrobacter]MCC3290235.1 PspC domain-containing protein [Arthrobacter sp. zg-Y1110]MCC3300254.1 PspC domain-containing protein [Arthrobacter sp. zg-Y895]UWX84383.1 PspC domain-containing protein [Arthrobacter sp. zg-Y1110]
MNPSPSPDSGAHGPAARPSAEHPPAPAGSHAAGNGSTSTGATAAGGPGAPSSGGLHSGFFNWIRSLGLPRGGDRWFGGVATGIAARTGLDPVLVRGLFVVLGAFGIGLLVYGVAWALLPEPDGRIHLEEAIRGDWTSGMTGALIFAILGMGGPGASFLGADGWFGAVVWTLFWIGAGVAAVYWFSTGKGRFHLSGHGAAADASGDPDSTVAFAPPAGAGANAPEAGPGKPVSLAKPGMAATGTDPAGSAPAGGTAPFTAVPLRGFAVPSGPVPSPAAETQRNAECKAKRVPGAPGSFAAALFGAALLAGGTVLAMDYLNVLSLGAPVSVALAAAAAVLGLGIVILGVVGRHSGGIGTAAVAALVASLLTQGSMVNDNLLVASNADWVPRDAAQAGGGYTVIAANGTVDLRETETSGNFEVPASVAAGNLAILVPEDAPVTIKFGMAAGNVEVNDGSDRQEYSGLWQPSDERTLNDGADGDRITIDVRGLAGNVLVTTEESDL